MIKDILLQRTLISVEPNFHNRSMHDLCFILLLITIPNTLSPPFTFKNDDIDSDSESNNLVNMQFLTNPQDIDLAHLMIDGQSINRRTSSQWTSLLTIRHV